jgi:hypothetical protein
MQGLQGHEYYGEKSARLKNGSPVIAPAQTQFVLGLVLLLVIDPPAESSITITSTRMSAKGHFPPVDLSTERG